MVWWVVMAFTAILTITSFRLLPQLASSFRQSPSGFILPVFAVAGLLGIQWFLRARNDGLAFASSCAYVVGMLTSVAFSLYPNVLPASTDPNYSLTIANAKAADYGLKIGLVWWIIGMALASAYTIHTYRNFAGKVRVAETEKEEGY